MHQFALNAVNVGMKSGNTFVTKLFIVIYPTLGSTIDIVLDSIVALFFVFKFAAHSS